MVISISGKSGSGKTFIAKQITKYFDAELISFDEISHKTLEDKMVLEKIKTQFGIEVFENNILNRKKLGKIVFSDNKKLDLLNSICQSKMEEIIDEIMQKDNNKIYILEYALLPKMKYFNNSDCKILIKASPSIRKTRIISRDNISEEYYLSRENNSINYNEKDFDIIIENDYQLNIEKIVKKIKEVLCSEKQ